MSRLWDVLEFMEQNPEKGFTASDLSAVLQIDRRIMNRELRAGLKYGYLTAKLYDDLYITINDREERWVERNASLAVYFIKQ